MGPAGQSRVPGRPAAFPRALGSAAGPSAVVLVGPCRPASTVGGALDGRPPRQCLPRRRRDSLLTDGSAASPAPVLPECGDVCGTLTEAERRGPETARPAVRIRRCETARVRKCSLRGEKVLAEG